MRKTLVMGFVGLSLLTGCDATGGIGAEGSGFWNLRHMSSTAKNQYVTKKCQQYGYKAGTDAMRDCIADERRNL